jgi:regulator of ribonuclease activity A
MPKTADLYDRYGDELAVPEPLFADFGGHTEFQGRVETVKVFESNPLIRDFIEQPGDGRVLVVDGGGSLRCALVGDVMATIAAENGWHGLVIFGCIRDAMELEQIPIGIKALATNPARSAKRPEGLSQVPVRFGGVEFRSGQYLYADTDGIVVADRPLD